MTIRQYSHIATDVVLLQTLPTVADENVGHVNNDVRHLVAGEVVSVQSGVV